MAAQLKLPASPDLMKVVGGVPEHKGDMMSGSRMAKNLGMNKGSIRVGCNVDLPGTEVRDPLKGLPGGY